MTMVSLSEQATKNAVIMVIGVGGGGSNSVEHMIAEKIQDVLFVCANTDAQALRRSSAPTLIQLGDGITKGLGAGADPKVGRAAAEADREKIKLVLQGVDMVFITCGEGGGTGTGAAPIFAEVAKELGVLTVAIVTKPFSFEGDVRNQVAADGLRELSKHVDSLITIPNNNLLKVLGKSVSVLNAFKAANNVLAAAVQGIADLVTQTGLINVDFADVKTVMSKMGLAMMGTGIASGENRAREAAEAAVSSPLLDDINLSGARGVLVNITAGNDITIGEFEEIGEVIKSFASKQATVVLGTAINPDLQEELRVTVVVTGLDSNQAHGGLKLADITHSDGAIDYQKLDKPSFTRRHSGSSTSTIEPREPHKTTARETAKAPDLDYLDIPAFLRKKEEETTDL